MREQVKACLYDGGYSALSARKESASVSMKRDLRLC